MVGCSPGCAPGSGERHDRSGAGQGQGKSRGATRRSRQTGYSTVDVGVEDQTVKAKEPVYVSLVILALVLATGMSWSHVRRRISGQADVDAVDEGH